MRAETFPPGFDPVQPTMGGGDKTKEPRKSNPLPMVDVGDFIFDEVPPREWFVENMIPHRQVTMLAGAGKVGKTLVALQLAMASASDRDWLGHLPRSGPVLYLNNEDEMDEFKRRVRDILNGSAIEASELAGRLFIRTFADLDDPTINDAVLATTNKPGTITLTEMYHRVEDTIIKLRPVLTILDNSADLFGGNEISRSEVRAFIAALRRLAMKYDMTIILLSHPSLQGLKDGTGLSGSTSWMNSVRSWLNLKKLEKKNGVAADDDGEPDDPYVRILEQVTQNYGPSGGAIKIRWDAGRFVLDQQATGYEKAAREDVADRLMLDLAEKYEREEIKASNNPNTRTFGPKLFAKESEAKQAHVSELELVRAMDRLLKAGKLHIIKSYWGPASGRSMIIAVKRDPDVEA